MRFSAEEIRSISELSGHRPDVLEKVVHLLHLLNALNTHPFLKGKWVLKGGTALNVFALDLPRLSVDIDINYIGALDREEMLAERPKIEQAMQAVFSREGYTVRRIPDEHAGGKWRLRYVSYTGQGANLEVDLNMMLRQPLWDIHHSDSRPLGPHIASGIPILDIHELTAGKLAALMARGQARDIFDCYQLFKRDDLNSSKLRLGFVIYGAMNRKDWRTINIDDIGFDTGDINSQLIPTLDDEVTKDIGTPGEYGNSLVNDCKRGMNSLLPFNKSEQEFLDLILDQGKIDGSILTSDPVLRQRIESHPSLHWKAFNVMKHKGM